MREASMRNKLLARVHITKQEIGIADDVYREMLMQFFKVDSAKFLDDMQLTALLALLNPHISNGITPKQMGYIDHLLSISPVQAFEAFASRVIKRKIFTVRHLTSSEASLVIRALQNYGRKNSRLSTHAVSR